MKEIIKKVEADIARRALKLNLQEKRQKKKIRIRRVVKMDKRKEIIQKTEGDIANRVWKWNLQEKRKTKKTRTRIVLKKGNKRDSPKDGIAKRALKQNPF